MMTPAAGPQLTAHKHRMRVVSGLTIRVLALSALAGTDFLAVRALAAAQPAMEQAQAPAVVTSAVVQAPVRREFVFAADGVTFDARFPAARLDQCRRTGPDAFSVVITPENKPINPSPWFAFAVRAETSKTIVVNLHCEGGPLRYRPKISVDGRSWITLPEESFSAGESNSDGVIRLKVGPEPLWVSAQEIIGVEQLEAWGRALERLPFVTRSEIGRSLQGRPLHKLEIGNPKADAFLVVIGRQHPPETTGTLALMGFVETLVGDSALAREFRRQFGVLLVPLVNPDGVENGHWRHSVAGVDLNRDWGPFRQPETRAVRSQILALRDRGPIFLFLDFHSTFFDVFYTRTDDQQTTPPGLVKRWVDGIHSRFPDYPVKRSASPNSESPTSLSWMHKTFGVPAVTYEIGDNTDRARLRQLAAGAAEETMSLLLKARSEASGKAK